MQIEIMDQDRVYYLTSNGKHWFPENECINLDPVMIPDMKSHYGMNVFRFYEERMSQKKGPFLENKRDSISHLKY